MAEVRRYPARRTLAVVLNYNGAADTIRCVEWLSRLLPEPPSILVVDNASTDDSIASIRAEHPGLEILALPANLGFSGGNNRGIEQAVARARAVDRPFDFIWLINNDTYGTDDTLAALIRQAHTDERIGAVGSLLFSPLPQRRIRSRATRVVPFLAISWSILDRNHTFNSLCGASMLLRMTAIEQVGLLDETFFFTWEDADLSQRLLKAGWKLAVADDSIVTHKEGATAAAATEFRIFQHVRGIVLFARRHSPAPWFSATFATMLCAGNCLLLRLRPALLKPLWLGFADGWRSAAVPVPQLRSTPGVEP